MKSKTGFLALSLLGFIGVVGIACGGSSDSGDDTSTAGTTSTTAGTGSGIGGSTSTAGTNSASGTTNNSSGTGNTTAGADTGGTAAGGNSNGNGGNTNGGRTNNGGAGGFMNSASCPAAAPMDGDTCMLPGTGGSGTGGTGGTGAGGRTGGGNNNLNCLYGTTFCRCQRMGNGQNAMRAWACGMLPTGNGGNGNGNGGNTNGGNANGGAGGNTPGMAMCGDAPANGDTCTGFGACSAGAGCRCRQGMVQNCN